jgi:hypothetical protein
MPTGKLVFGHGCGNVRLARLALQPSHERAEKSRRLYPTLGPCLLAKGGICPPPPAAISVTSRHTACEVVHNSANSSLPNGRFIAPDILTLTPQSFYTCRVLH